MKAVFPILLALLACSPAFADRAPGSVYEETLLETIREIQNLNLDLALAGTRDLIRQYPHSRLGHMLFADLLLAKAEPLTHIGSGIAADRAKRDFHYEIRQRWQHDASPAHRGMYPENILHLAAGQPYAILVDLERSRVYVFRNAGDRLELEADYFTTIGLKGYGKQREGDQKTPIGIYHVTRHIDGEELPDLYGAGAFPLSYPNAWDRRLGRTGSGIWIHGTPSYTYNRSPWASDGCIVVSNPDFRHVDRYVRPELNTPVIVADTINWLDRAQWQARRRDALDLLSRWQDDWQSLDHARYRAHYSPTELDANGRDFAAWDAYKRRVNQRKTFIRVDYSGLNVFDYPGEDGLMLMQFVQHYRSNNYNVDGDKEIYWRRGAGRWRIVYENGRRIATPAVAAVDN